MENTDEILKNWLIYDMRNFKIIKYELHNFLIIIIYIFGNYHQKRLILI